MQSVSSRIWTRVAVSISYDDNHYTTGTSLEIQLLFFPFLFLVIFVSLMFVLLILFLVAVISLPFRRCIDALTLSSVLACPLPSFFVDAYSLSTSFLGYKALCLVMSFLILWSICWISTLVHFKNGTEYIRRDTCQVFIPLMTFLLCSLILNSFLVLLGYSFFIFFIHLRLFDDVRLPYLPVYVRFLSSKRSDFSLIWQFYSFRHVSFFAFLYEHAKFHP